MRIWKRSNQWKRNIPWKRAFPWKYRWYFLIAGLVLAIFIGIGILCPMVFYLNDDVAIRSILSGGYTGTPDGHGIYMKYPLTGIISLLYGLAGSIPWFSLMLSGCFVLSASAVLCRVYTLLAGENAADHAPGKKRGAHAVIAAGIFCIMIFLCAALFLPHFIYMHYTIAASALGASALFLVITHSGEGRGSGSRSDGICSRILLPILLLLLCYCIRSQVFYLLLPYLGVAVLWQLCRGGMKKQMLFLGLLAAGWLVCAAANDFLYREWQEYEEYNDSRTLLYDYTWYLPYEKYEHVYEELGLARPQYDIIERYATALDASLDSGVLRQTAEASAAVRDSGRSFTSNLKECLQAYYNHVRYEDTTYKYLVAAGYLAVFLCLLPRKDRRIFYGRRIFHGKKAFQGKKLLLLGCMGAGRNLIWLYLIWQGRFPERIYVPLYLLEILMLAGMLLTSVDMEERPSMEEKPSGGEKHSRENVKNKKTGCLLYYSAIVILGGLVLAVAVDQFSGIYRRAAEQEEKQMTWNLLRKYCGEQNENLYLLDVYSMVSYGAEAFEEPVRAENYLLAGGWMTGTPLMNRRFEAIGALDGGEALAYGEKVYYIAGAEVDITWLEEYMVYRFGNISMKQDDIIFIEGEPVFLIYDFWMEEGHSTKE